MAKTMCAPKNVQRPPSNAHLFVEMRAVGPEMQAPEVLLAIQVRVGSPKLGCL